MSKTSFSILNRSELWTVGNGTKVAICDLETLHLIRILAYCKDSLRKAEQALSDLPKIYHNQSLRHNDGRLFEEWVEIIKMELQFRANQELEQQKTSIQAALSQLETIEEKRARLLAELEKLK